MSAVIEFQGFPKSDGKYIIKELAIIDVQNKCCNTWLFKSPSMLVTKDVNWLRDHFHGLDRDSGDIDYSELREILRSYTIQFRQLFTKGDQKASFLSSLLPSGVNVINLELYGCPSLKKLETGEGCLIDPHVKGNFHCARKNCHKLADWCMKNNI